MAEKAPAPVEVPLTDEEKAQIRRWQIALVSGAVIFLILTVVFQIWTSMQDTVVTVDKTTTGKEITTTDGTVPPAALVTTCIGGGVLLLIAAAFYGRIKKFSFAGVEAEIGGAAEKAVKEEATEKAEVLQKPEKAEEIAEKGIKIAKRKYQGRGLAPADVAVLSVNDAVREMNLTR